VLAQECLQSSGSVRETKFAGVSILTGPQAMCDIKSRAGTSAHHDRWAENICFLPRWTGANNISSLPTPRDCRVKHAKVGRAQSLASMSGMSWCADTRWNSMASQIANTGNSRITTLHVSEWAATLSIPVSVQPLNLCAICVQIAPNVPQLPRISLSFLLKTQLHSHWPFASGAKGRWFESTRAYHAFNNLQANGFSSPTQNLPKSKIADSRVRLRHPRKFT